MQNHHCTCGKLLSMLNESGLCAHCIGVRVGNRPRPHKPAPPARYCSDCGVSISQKGKTGRCIRCSMAAIGRANALPRATCPCGKPASQARGKFCSHRCSTDANKRMMPERWVESVGMDGAYDRTQKLYPLNGRECDMCQKPAHVRHHRDFNPANTDPDNISFLCRNHHQWLHARIRMLS